MNRLRTLTESALYNPVDDPEVFVDFCFALIVVASLQVDKLSMSWPRVSKRGSRYLPASGRHASTSTTISLLLYQEYSTEFSPVVLLVSTPRARPHSPRECHLCWRPRRYR